MELSGQLSFCTDSILLRIVEPRSFQAELPRGGHFSVEMLINTACSDIHFHKCLFSSECCEANRFYSTDAESRYHFVRPFLGGAIPLFRYAIRLGRMMRRAAPLSIQKRA
jgi:hypothetical protein